MDLISFPEWSNGGLSALVKTPRCGMSIGGAMGNKVNSASLIALVLTMLPIEVVLAENRETAANPIMTFAVFLLLLLVVLVPYIIAKRISKKAAIRQSIKPQRQFINPTKIKNWTKWLLYAQVVMATIAVISNLLEYQLLSDFEKGVYTSEEMALSAANANDARQLVVGVIQSFIFVITGIAILKWIYRANHNVRALGATGMAFTPGWSIGWYFIPIAHLWKPYQALKEIWKASSKPQDWENHTTSSLLPWWWFFWIVYIVLGNASFRLIVRADELNELITANIVTQLSDLVGIPLSLIVIAIISKVHEMQMSHARAKQHI